MTTILNNKTILKPGDLAKIGGKRWGSSTKYLLKNQQIWQDIPSNSPILIVDVSYQYITFLFEQSLYHIPNTYNDGEGIPYWCQVINEKL